MTAHRKHKYVDPILLSKLKNMNLVARCAVEGFFTGMHPSPFHGFSVEYSDHRAYQAGDDPKYLDWKMYGRSRKLYIKQFLQETNLTAYIMLDSSRSMSFASGDSVTKLEYGSYLAAALAYLMLMQHDCVALGVFAEDIRTWIPGRSRRTHLSVVLKTLQHNQPHGRTRLADVLHNLAERTRRRGIVILISDLLDDVDDVKRGLAHLKYLKHDVILFHLLDRQELELDYEGLVQFEDLESSRVVRVFPKSIQATFRQNVGRFMEQVRTNAHRNDIDYHLMNTSESLDRAFMAYLAKRKVMG
ncbi:MAG TPA: DUF58 domain-containing protein [Sedimentisphaerales bacterium]|nr:DUF58 domain-containing protein [Sedimentisphaerales bacterium]